MLDVLLLSVAGTAIIYPRAVILAYSVTALLGNRAFRQGNTRKALRYYRWLSRLPGGTNQLERNRLTCQLVVPTMLQELHEYQEAIRAARGLLKSRSLSVPQAIGLRCMLCNCLEKSGDGPAADTERDLIRSTLGKAADTQEQCHVHGDVAYNGGDPARALAFYQQALALLGEGRTKAHALLHLKAAGMAGLLEDAEIGLRHTELGLKCTVPKGRSHDLLVLQANAYVRLQRLDQAARVVDRARQYSTRDRSLVQQNQDMDLSAAVALHSGDVLRTLKLVHGQETAVIRYQCYRLQGDHAAALACVTPLYDADLSSVPWMERLLRADYRRFGAMALLELGRSEEALRLLEPCTSALGPLPPYQRRYRATLAWARAACGLADEASVEFDTDTLPLYGRAALSRGDFETAAGLYEKLVARSTTPLATAQATYYAALSAPGSARSRALYEQVVALNLPIQYTEKAREALQS